MAVYLKGGYNKVEYNTENVWTGAQTEIPNLLEVNVQANPQMEDFADGTRGSSGKSYSVTIRSSDAAGAWVSALETAAAAMTPMYFRFTPGTGATPNFVLLGVRLGEPHIQPADPGSSLSMVITATGFAAQEEDVLAINLS
jgi:hypothetical protein